MQFPVIDFGLDHCVSEPFNYACRQPVVLLSLVWACIKKIYIYSNVQNTPTEVTSIKI